MSLKGHRSQVTSHKRALERIAGEVWLRVRSVACVALSVTLLAGAVCAQERPASSDLINKAWEAHGKRDLEQTFKLTGECIALYQADAEKQQASLKEMPKNKDEIEAVQALNDVATAYFIQAEAMMRQDKKEEAKKIFELIVNKYPYAQGWDMRGWYWSLKLAAEQSIKKIETGTIEIETEHRVSQLKTSITLNDPGSESFVDYEKYGTFHNAGTKDYRYEMSDQAGLAQAVGEGIYPNTLSIRKDPAFKKALSENRLAGDLWDFVHSPDLEAAFFKWATCSEPQGVKLFYTALLLEKSGLITHAIKCYYAILVHFPGSYGWTYFKTPWYIGQAAIAKIEFLLRRNPELGYRLINADIRIINGFDNDVANDIVVASPGRFVKVGSPEDIYARPPEPQKVLLKRGEGKVHLIRYTNGGWQLFVEGRPYVIRAVTYTPTKVGQSPDDGTMGNWMEEDFNNNGLIDGPFDSFVDKNGNNEQDADEPAVGDFKLMQEMGVNTIRLYHHPHKVNKELLRKLYNDYGIRVIMGDFLGKYTLGSGAPWNPGTDYNNPEHKKNMIESVTRMVNEHKDEPYVLFWLLGNENVYGYACNADKDPEAFFKFANEAALHIKSLDPEHPVAICSGDILYLDRFGKFAPDVDIFGANAYRGDYGFGFFWKQVREEADRPAFITEFGCPAYARGRSAEEAETMQAEYHRGAWEDIEHNMAFGQGAGNALGGIIFEWLDEWWKGYEPSIHDKKGLWVGPFPDGTMYEEWLGICGQGDGSKSPFLRNIRKVYYMYQEKWTD